MKKPKSLPQSIDALLNSQKNASDDSTVGRAKGNSPYRRPIRKQKLSSIVSQAGAYADYQASFEAALPARLRGKVRVLYTDNGLLHVECEEASTATLLRLQQHTIVNALADNSHFTGVTAIKPKIRPVERRKKFRQGFHLPDAATLQWLANTTDAIDLLDAHRHADEEGDVVDQALSQLVKTLQQAARRQSS